MEKDYNNVETIKNKYSRVKGEVLENSNELNAHYIRNLMLATETMAFREGKAGLYREKDFWILKTAAALFYEGNQAGKMLKCYDREDKKIVLNIIKKVKNKAPKTELTDLESILSDAVEFVDKRTI